MKFSYRQILASAGGAVLSAVIASIFGVTGTIIGVAIGSVAATMGSALLFQSIERTNKAVKQVVVRVPDSTKLLRRLGGTKVAGVTESETAVAMALTEETATSTAQTGGALETETSHPSVDQSTEYTPATAEPATTGSSFRWPVIAGAVAAVFVFSLLLVTAVELIAGRPLADLFRAHSGGTTVEKIFESPPPTLPTPTSTTTTTTGTSSTTTSSSSSTTTSVGGSTTSSTAVGSTSTTSPTSTTTSVPGTPTSTNATNPG